MTKPAKGPLKGPLKGGSGAPETVTLNVRDIVRDATFQVRARLDPGVVSSYANVLANDCVMPPVRVAKVNGALILVDGWHRLAAHEIRGIRTVEAEVVNATASEAKWMAAAANLTHGLPLRKAEVRKAFQALIHARRHIAGPRQMHSYRVLAGLLGGLVRHTTVANWMRADFPAIARKMADGDPGRASREAERDEERTFLNTFNAAVDAANANAPAVRDPNRRWEMAGAVRALLKAIEEGGEMLEGDF